MLKNKLILAILGLASVLVIAGIVSVIGAEEPPPATTAPESPTTLPDPVAVVNDQPISRDLYEIYAQQRQRQMGDIDSAEARQALVDELITQELLVQEAEKQNLDQDPELAMQLELIRRNLLATAALRNQLQQQAPSEEAIEREYQELVAGMQDQEYKASHILVESEQQAREIIEELNQGADFAELAQTHSKDTSSAEGGDLGWFTTDVMVQPFGEAIAALEEGEYTSEPVQTQFGWHVIKLEDVRDATPPALEELRPQIVQMLQSRMITENLEKLREQAKVEVKIEKVE